MKIGSGSKIVRATKYFEFLSLSDYIVKFFVTTAAANPLRTGPSETASEIKGVVYEQLSFYCLEINGDLVKIACNEQCEGCPEEKIGITGWVRWRKDGKIIIEKYFAC